MAVNQPAHPLDLKTLSYWSGVFDAVLNRRVVRRHYQNADYVRGRKRLLARKVASTITPEVRALLLPVASAIGKIVP